MLKKLHQKLHEIHLSHAFQDGYDLTLLSIRNLSHVKTIINCLEIVLVPGGMAKWKWL